MDKFIDLLKTNPLHALLAVLSAAVLFLFAVEREYFASDKDVKARLSALENEVAKADGIKINLGRLELKVEYLSVELEKLRSKYED